MKSIPRAISAPLMVLGCLLGASFVLFALRGYPPPSVDSMVYLFPSWNIAAGSGLVNNAVALTDQIDPSGLHRAIYYPPLHFWLVGHVMPAATPESAFLVVALLGILCLGLQTWILATTYQTLHGRSDAYGDVFVAICMMALADLWIGHRDGRTEATVLFVFLTAWRLGVGRPAAARWPVLGLGLGLIAGTNAAAALLTAPLIGLHHAWHYPTKKALALTLRDAVVSVLVFLTILATLTPGVSTTIQGIINHAHIFAFPPMAPYAFKFWFHYIAQTRMPLMGLPVGLGILWGCREIWRRRATLGSRPLAGGAVAVWAGVLWMWRRALWNTNYNWIVLLPLFFLVLLTVIASSKTPRWERALALAAPLAMALNVWRYVMLLPDFERSGMNLRQARRVFAAVESTCPPGSVMDVSSGLWPLASHPQRLGHVCSSSPTPVCARLMQESLLPNPPPPVDDQGFVLSETHLVGHRPTLGGVPLSSHPSGYGFVVYRPPTPAQKPRSAPGRQLLEE